MPPDRAAPETTATPGHSSWLFAKTPPESSPRKSEAEARETIVRERIARALRPAIAREVYERDLRALRQEAQALSTGCLRCHSAETTTRTPSKTTKAAAARRRLRRFLRVAWAVMASA